MKIIRKYWKVLLLAAGALASAAFYVKEPDGMSERLLLLTEEETFTREESLEILTEEAEVKETIPEKEGFTEKEKEELRKIISECVQEYAGEAVRTALQEEFSSLLENGQFTAAFSEYAEKQSELVHINKADAEELKSLSGIGDAKASAILAYREEHGGFQSIDELTNVSGISANLLEKIRDRLAL